MRGLRGRVRYQMGGERGGVAGRWRKGGSEKGVEHRPRAVRHRLRPCSGPPDPPNPTTPSNLPARPGSKQGQDAGAAADIQHDLVLEQEWVLLYRRLVRASAHAILEHLLMDACRKKEEGQVPGWARGRERRRPRLGRAASLACLAHADGAACPGLTPIPHPRPCPRASIILGPPKCEYESK